MTNNGLSCIFYAFFFQYKGTEGACSPEYTERTGHFDTSVPIHNSGCLHVAFSEWPTEWNLQEHPAEVRCTQISLMFADRVRVSKHWIMVQALAHTPVPIMVCHKLCTVIVSISGS